MSGVSGMMGGGGPPGSGNGLSQMRGGGMQFIFRNECSSTSL